MNKVVVAVLVSLVLVTGAVFLLGNNDDSETATNSQNQETTIETQQINSSDDESAQPAEQSQQSNSSSLGYVDYSEANLAASEGSKRVVFFHAPWCSTCNFYEGQIEDQGVPEGVTILKVDYDSEDELKELYGVTIQSTFVLLDENGEVLQSWPFARGLNGIQDLYNAVI